MRCSCTQCGTYMVHHDTKSFECICPQCQNTCRVCMGQGLGNPGIIRTKEGKVTVPDEILKRFEDENVTEKK